MGLTSACTTMEVAVNKLSLKMKLAIGFGAMLVVVCTTAFSSYMAINKLSALSKDVAQQLSKAVLAYSADDGYEMQTNGMRTFLLTGSDEALKHRQEGIDQAKASMEQLGALLETDRGKEVYA